MYQIDGSRSSLSEKDRKRLVKIKRCIEGYIKAFESAGMEDEWIEASETMEAVEHTEMSVRGEIYVRTKYLRKIDGFMRKYEKYNPFF
jgi:hypothetical protein